MKQRVCSEKAAWQISMAIRRVYVMAFDDNGGLLRGEFVVAA